MYLRELTSTIDRVKGAGPATVKAFARGGIVSVADLLSHYPRAWEDWSVPVPLRDFARYPEDSICVTVKVIAHDWHGFGKKRVHKVYIEDKNDSGVRAALIGFGDSPAQERRLEGLQSGQTYRILGKFTYSQRYTEIQSTVFEFRPLQEAAGDLFHLVPVYPLNA